jgi:hypothetical protein
MQPGGSSTIVHRTSNDEDDDFEDEQPLLEPFTQLSLDKPSTSKHNRYNEISRNILM